MALQFLPLQQRQQPSQAWRGGRRPGRSPVSEALTPPTSGITAAQRFAPNTVLDRMRAEEAKEAERKYNEKMMKMQHEQEMEKLKFAAAAKEDAQTQQTTMGNVIAQAEQQGATRQQIEDNPEPAAKEMYNLIKSMPLDTQNVLLNQLFTPATPTGTITAPGKQVTMPPKYNPIAQVFLTKGWATIDKGGRPILSEPEREFEKATFEIVEKGGKVYKLNTATGEEEEIGATDKPEQLIAKVNADANAGALAIAKTGEVDFITAKYDILVDGGMDEELAKDLSEIKEIPKDKKASLYTTFINWLKGLGEMPKDWQPKGAGAPAFNEANVTALTDVISDDVTEAERAHLKTQGASDADINEAIKRKAGE